MFFYLRVFVYHASMENWVDPPMIGDFQFVS